jgi:hypothetical protein
LGSDTTGNAYFGALRVISFLLFEKRYRILDGVSAMVAVGVGVNVAAANPAELGQALLGYLFFPVRHLTSLSTMGNGFLFTAFILLRPPLV